MIRTPKEMVVVVVVVLHVGISITTSAFDLLLEIAITRYHPIPSSPTPLFLLPHPSPLLAASGSLAEPDDTIHPFSSPTPLLTWQHRAH